MLIDIKNIKNVKLLTNQWLEEESGLAVLVEMLPVAPHSLKEKNEY